MDAYQNCLKEYDGEMREAFKRIIDTYHSRRRQTKEMLKWCRAHPSPRHPQERSANLRAALFDN